MKIFFDTNVIISSFLTQGISYEVIMDAVIHHQVYYSEFLVKEVEKVLKDKFCFSSEFVQEIKNFLKKSFIKGKTSKSILHITSDNIDNQLLSDALNSQVDLFITGDKELLKIKKIHQIKIISSSQYWFLS